jgi:hypothetical protein
MNAAITPWRIAHCRRAICAASRELGARAGHEVVEHFLVLKGVLTVGWAWGDEVIEARLGPKGTWC